MDKTIPLYDILGLDKSCTVQDIRKRYRELVKKNHPDQGGDQELFELIQLAYDILGNPKKRAEYDELDKQIKQSTTDHLQLKEAAEEFFKSQEATAIKKPKESVKKDFEKANIELDQRRGFSRKDLDSTLTSDDATKRLKDMELIRNQDDIEDKPEQLFDKNNFNIGQFNKAFEEMNRPSDAMVVHKGNPEAFNGGLEEGYCTIDKSNDIFDDDDNIVGENFGSIKDTQLHKKHKKLTKEEIRKLKEADYTEGHSKKGDKDYKKSLEDKLKERQEEDLKLTDKKFKDFDPDPTCGGYGISHQVSGTNGTLDWDETPDVKERYKRLLESRKDLDSQLQPKKTIEKKD